MAAISTDWFQDRRRSVVERWGCEDANYRPSTPGRLPQYWNLQEGVRSRLQTGQSGLCCHCVQGLAHNSSKLDVLLPSTEAGMYRPEPRLSMDLLLRSGLSPAPVLRQFSYKTFPEMFGSGLNN